MLRRSLEPTPPSPGPSAKAALRQGVFAFGRGDPAKLTERFYALMEKALTARPEAYPFDDLTLAIMVRRRH